ncbi:TetR/AcrR family transcriptional regulator [Burkholderiaceae bacterium DAT-1]|nr:TetR/AcrR family transcriptional regulator [Burkholderiaceae bacterium DAT-1]
MNGHAKHLPADERKAATIEAVVDLAAGQNPGDITTAAIAKHMGLTQGALFRHFPSKDAILEAVMGWVADRLLARIDRATDAIDHPLGKLEAAFMAHTSFVVEHPGVPRMLFGELQRPGESLPKKMVQTLIQQYGKRLKCWLADGIASGQLRRDLNPEAASALFIGSIQGLVMQSMIAGDIELITRQAPGVFDLYRRSVQAGLTEVQS